jgi:hypothetical protein
MFAGDAGSNPPLRMIMLRTPFIVSNCARGTWGVALATFRIQKAPLEGSLAAEIADNVQPNSLFDISKICALTGPLADSSRPKVNHLPRGFAVTNSHKLLDKRGSVAEGPLVSPGQ